MKIKTFTLQKVTFLAVVMLIIGCIPQDNVIPYPSQTQNVILTSSPYPTAPPKPTLVFPPSPTSVPNMQPDKIPLLIKQLQNEDCKLPCYLGIIPGETTLRNGIAILKSLGGKEFISGTGKNPYQRETDGAFLYTYEFDIGEPDPEGNIISHSVTLITDNDLIQSMEISASPIIFKNELIETAMETYQFIWNGYSLENIFLQMGEPENVYLPPKERPNMSGTTWLLVYAKQNTQIYLFDEWLGNKICPNNEVKILRMALSHLDSPFSIYADGRVPPTDREIYLPIEEMFGINTSDFYKQVLANPSICFELKQ